MRVDLIKKLHLKKGHKYMVFFPRSSGITAQDLEAIPSIPELLDVQFLLEDTRGIRVVEVEE